MTNHHTNSFPQNRSANAVALWRWCGSALPV
jgi:hypothetical protein